LSWRLTSGNFLDVKMDRINMGGDARVSSKAFLLGVLIHAIGEMGELRTASIVRARRENPP
jgi:hypothetical protein